MPDRVQPGTADFIDLFTHAERVNARRGGQRADHHRHVVFAALRIDDFGEQKRAPLVGGHAAEKLPAHQRVQLGILVDRTIDAQQETLLFKVAQMSLQIESRLLVADAGRGAGSAGRIRHGSRFAPYRRVRRKVGSLTPGAATSVRSGV